MKIKKKSIYKLLFEFLSIVFAVSLALGLNAYKEKTDNKENSEVLRQAIIRECASNMSKLDSVISGNEHLFVYLDSVMKLPNDEDIKPYFSYSTEFYDKSAWSLAQNSNLIGELENDFLFDASNIYETQLFLSEFTKDAFIEIGVIISRQSVLNDKDITQSIYFYTVAMMETQKSLRKEIESFLGKYDNKKGAK